MESTCANSKVFNPPVNSLDTDNIFMNEADMSTRYMDSSEREESECQAWFQTAVNEAMGVPYGYLKVAVLILRWHEDIDDFSEGHSSEIKELKDLLRGKFNYEVEEKKLGIEVQKSQHELNLAVMEHIHKHDGKNNLLIVYYTGHGILNKEKQLKMSARGYNGENPNTAAVAYWHEVDDMLLKESVDSDVFVILDCCFASNAHKGPSNHDRVYELLAAAPKDQPTRSPGPNSMTAALIFALECMLAEPESSTFTTPQLQATMNSKDHMSAMLHDRLRVYDKHVQLLPLKERYRENKGKEFPSLTPERGRFELSFSLTESKLDQQTIEKFARELPEVCKKANLPIRRIDWIKMGPKTTPSFAGTVKAVMQKLRRESRHKRKRSRSASPTTQDPTLALCSGVGELIETGHMSPDSMVVSDSPGNVE